MTGRYFLSGSLLFAAAMLSPACTSRDETAAASAATAADALQQGQLAVARKEINKALAIRDDVSDYWMLSAHIALAEQNYGSAFESYESVLNGDHSNVEALTRLCQIALSADQADRAERYADQLAVLHPGDKSAVTVRAAIAFKRGDKQTAATLLDQALTSDPADPLALTVKSKLLLANEDYAGAAKAAEAALAAPGDPAGRIAVLKDIYVKQKNADGYAQTVARLASAYPQSASAQLDYATSLYNRGDAKSGLAVARRVLTLRPDDVGAASAILYLWLAQGPSAMPMDTIVTNAAGGSLETKATYAHYAISIGHPEIALKILGDAAAQDKATAANANAKAARALARAMLGQTDAAAREIAAVLSVDEDQPRALAARGWMRAKAGDSHGAIEDLRHALSGDADNASARLALADLQSAQGDASLATATLQDGLNDPGADPRIAAKLATLLRKQGRASEAAAVLEAYARANPFTRQPRA